MFSMDLSQLCPSRLCGTGPTTSIDMGDNIILYFLKVENFMLNFKPYGQNSKQQLETFLSIGTTVLCGRKGRQTSLSQFY